MKYAHAFGQKNKQIYNFYKFVNANATHKHN
jgi:hypothetical protein